MGKKSAKIIETKKMTGEAGLIIIEHVGIDPLIALREELEGIEDKRVELYAEHVLADIVMITLLAVMARANEWSGIVEFAQIKAGWLKRFLVLTHGIPAHDTIQRVMSMIDGSILYRLCIPFLIRRLDILAATARERRMAEDPGAPEAPKLIAIDGKTSRGSKRNKSDRDAVRVLHTVSACSTDRGLCLSSGGR